LSLLVALLPLLPQGAPGEGKLTVAVAAARCMWRDEKFLGGAFYASMSKVDSADALTQK
jgi:hypothetical protein